VPIDGKVLSVKKPAVDTLLPIAQAFARQHVVEQIQPYGSGNVNDTYLVTLTAPAPHLDSRYFVLQRVNTRVFPHPELILVNMRTFLSHIAQRVEQETGRHGQVSTITTPSGRRWHMPQIISNGSGTDSYVDQEQAFWRAITLIEGAKTYGRIRDAAHAYESGFALGHFHALLSDLAPTTLHDTLPGFHITPHYLAAYDAILTDTSARRRQQSVQREVVRETMRFVDECRAWSSVLEDALSRGELTLRSIHGDPKVDNILIDDESARAVSIIDLDTVKPGLVHYDIGDCLRSCCNPVGEETTDLESVHFDVELCRVILEGYLEETAGFFTEADYAYVYDSIRLITFELGLRFFSDYLAGDRYFKTNYPDHNLQRALVQFRLAASIEAQETTIRQIVEEQQRSAHLAV